MVRLPECKKRFGNIFAAAVRSIGPGSAGFAGFETSVALG